MESMGLEASFDRGKPLLLSKSLFQSIGKYTTEEDFSSQLWEQCFFSINSIYFELR